MANIEKIKDLMLEENQTIDFDGVLKFQSNWNYVMEFVEKINTMHIQGSPEIRIGKYFTEIFYSPISNGKEVKLSSVYRFDDSKLTRIQSVCSACLQFSEWYNQYKIQK